MQQIPLQPIPSQLSRVVLGNQNWQISLYQKPQGLFADINIDGLDIALGRICRNLVPLISREYAGPVGNLVFTDTQGSGDPDYAGLGGRYVLVYLLESEYALVRL